MENIKEAAQPALEKLLQSSPDELFAQLGLRQNAILADHNQAAMFDTTATFDAPFAGPMDTMKDFGRRFFDRFSKDAYALVCGNDEENATQRKKLLDAFGTGGPAFAAALTGVFMSWFGWAPAIAAVVAALVVRLFFQNAYGAMCECWKERLPK